jgi:hypothetical protein
MRDLIREKRHQQADAARAARAKYFQEGAHLSDDGHTVIVPSPGAHEPFIRDLKRYGFRFLPGYCSRWERDVRVPYRGRVWTSEQWIELGEKIINKHWRSA